jgi:hypothetical protein
MKNIADVLFLNIGNIGTHCWCVKDLILCY